MIIMNINNIMIKYSFTQVINIHVSVSKSMTTLCAFFYH